MRAVCELAVAHGVRVGAQPSYRDREGFGRGRRRDRVRRPGPRPRPSRWRRCTADRREAGTEVGYLKPHGALYNRIVRDDDQAQAVVDVALRSACR